MKISNIVSSEAFSIFGSIAEMMAAGIAAWATVLLYFTLDFTRHTLREAKATNENSEKALSESRETLKYQIERAKRLDRAWLCIEPSKAGIIIGSNTMKFNLSNIGNTPILDCKIATDLQIKYLTLAEFNRIEEKDIPFEPVFIDSFPILAKKDSDVYIFKDLKTLTYSIDHFPITDGPVRKIAIFIIHAQYKCELTMIKRETKVAFGLKKDATNIHFIGLPKYISIN